eukprot:GHVP01063600.1.p1 GENE.GHVP01063600.1~~GHVP01063600.1.p1  ORF type:complete len:492 (+),score=79.89 GHVP01063600.1:356-1831(+)
MNTSNRMEDALSSMQTRSMGDIVPKRKRSFLCFPGCVEQEEEFIWSPLPPNPSIIQSTPEHIETSGQIFNLLYMLMDTNNVQKNTNKNDDTISIRSSIRPYASNRSHMGNTDSETISIRSSQNTYEVQRGNETNSIGGGVRSYFFKRDPSCELDNETSSITVHLKPYNPDINITDEERASNCSIRDKARLIETVIQLIGIINTTNSLKDRTNMIDELYLQLQRQLTSNPTAQSYYRGMLLLYLILESIPINPKYIAFIKETISLEMVSSTRIEKKYFKRLVHKVTETALRQTIDSKTIVFSRMTLERLISEFENISVFCESLEEQSKKGLDGVPRFFNETYEILMNSEPIEGMFRLSSNRNEVNRHRRELDKGKFGILKMMHPRLLCNLLKDWLNGLEDPLIISVPKYKGSSINEVLSKMMKIRRIVLEPILILLKRLTTEEGMERTRMNSHSLAIVFSPCLFHTFETFGINGVNAINEEVEYVEWLIDNY